MKTLQTIKDEVAHEYGEKDWTRLFWHFDSPNLEIAMTKVCIRYGEALLLEAKEKFKEGKFPEIENTEPFTRGYNKALNNCGNEIEKLIEEIKKP